MKGRILRWWIVHHWDVCSSRVGSSSLKTQDVTPGAPGRDSSEDSVRKTTGLTYLGWCRIFDKWRWTQKKICKVSQLRTVDTCWESQWTHGFVGRERSLILRQIQIDRWVWWTLWKITKSKLDGNFPFQLPNQNLLGICFSSTTPFKNSWEVQKTPLSIFASRGVFFPDKKVLLPRFCPGEPLALEEQKRRKIWGKLGKRQKVGIIISVDFPFQILNF